MANPEGFAARLKSLRAAAKLTQVQLAERAGLHLHGLVKLERGEREPAWGTVVKLAEALGVKCDAFMEPPAKPRKPRPSH